MRSDGHLCRRHATTLPWLPIRPVTLRSYLMSKIAKIMQIIEGLK